LTIKKEELEALTEKLTATEEDKENINKRMSAQIHTKDEKLILYEKQIRENENEIKRLKEFERKSTVLQDELENLKLQMATIYEKI